LSYGQYRDNSERCFELSRLEQSGHQKSHEKRRSRIFRDIIGQRVLAGARQSAALQ
jgi:hypothetical protein